MVCPPAEIDWSSWATWSCLRQDIAPIATFVGAAIVAFAALAQARTARRRHQEQTAADRERRITESFAKAVEQLGSDKLETRLGAIYTLERISRESEREHWPIMELLTAFVRKHAPWPPRRTSANPFVKPQGSAGGEMASESTPAEKSDNEAEQASSRLATDIQAILTVLGRRNEEARKQDAAAGRQLDLAAVDLRRAYLAGASLERANLWFAHLEGANLTGANLNSANLTGANLNSANLMAANLEGANLAGANLEVAYLRTASGLTQRSLNMAIGNRHTVPPQGLTWPTHWLALAPAATQQTATEDNAQEG